MKKIVLAFTSLSALFMAACNGPSELPELKGKLINHSRFPNSDYQVTVLFSCKTASTFAPGTSCGHESRTAAPAADGSYVIPAMSLPAGIGHEYRLRMNVSLKNKESGIKPVHTYGSWDSYEGDIIDDLKKLETITLFQLNEQAFAYRPSSGMDSAVFARTVGRDSYVSLEFDFGQKIHSYDYKIAREGFKSESIETLPAAILFIPGSYAADAEVSVTGEIRNAILAPRSYNFAQFTRKTRFSSTLDESLRVFEFDDSAHVVPSREVNGAWVTNFNFHGNYAPGSEHNLFDGKLSLACEAGRLSGRLEVRPRPANTHQFAGEVPVQGTCSGETGLIRFPLQFATNVPEQTLTIRYDRVAGNSGVLLSKELGSMEEFEGSAYTLALSIRDSEKKVVGTAHIGRK